MSRSDSQGLSNDGQPLLLVKNKINSLGINNFDNRLILLFTGRIEIKLLKKCEGVISNPIPVYEGVRIY